jgi:hypothetical protein
LLIQLLQTHPNQKVLMAVALVSLLGVLTVGGRMLGIARQLEPKPLQLEFTWTARGAQKLLGQWTSDEQLKVHEWIWLDFPFIVAYVALFGSLCLLTARVTSGAPSTLGALLGVLALVAGLLDVLENVCMLRLLEGPREAPSAWLAAISSAAATLKFVLLLGCLIYVLRWGLPAVLAHL